MNILNFREGYAVFPFQGGTTARVRRSTIFDPVRNSRDPGVESILRNRVFHYSTSITQIFLASVFGFKGYLKVTLSMGALSELMPWVFSMPEAKVRFIGVYELASAFGLILPSLFRVRAELSAHSAACLSLVMVAAVVFIFHELR